MNKTILKIVRLLELIFMPMKIFFYKFISKISLKFIQKKNGFQLLKTFAAFFLMCCELQRLEINSIKVSLSHE